MNSKKNPRQLKSESRNQKQNPRRMGRPLERLVIGASLAALAYPAAAQTAATASTKTAGSTASAGGLPAFSFMPQKPAWLTDLSFGVKETYDDNIYEVSGMGAPEKSSWITTFAPVAGVNFAPLMGKESPIKALSLGYSPEVNVFHNAPSENFTANRLAQTIKAGAGPFSVNLENGFNYIDGNDVAPTYEGLDSNRSAYATGAPRERRKQIQDRSKIAMQFDHNKWFIRPTASLLFYDLMTDLRSTAGYQNYADRYDVNGGVDFGYKLTPGLAATLGYRYGHQYQQQFPNDIDKTHLSSPSDYQRVLVGLEGSPWKWLTLSALGGPDFRDYEGNSATHTTPVSNFHPITYYAEANATATITSNDKLSLRYKQWRWVSSTGKVPLFESLYELGYKRRLTDQLSWDLTGRIQSSDYNCGNVAASKRVDYMYTVATGVTFAVNKNLSFNVAYNLDLGRNAQDEIANAGYREFDHNVVSAGALFKW